MTDLEKLRIERDAWRFWFDEIAFFLSPGNGLTTDRVDMVFRDLETMDPTKFALAARMKPAEMAEYHTRALPIYLAVGKQIKERVA